MNGHAQSESDRKLPTDKPRKPRRRPWRYFAAGIVLLCLLAAGWYVLWGESETELNPKRLDPDYRKWLRATEEIDSCIEEAIEEPARQILVDLMIMHWFPRRCMHFPQSPYLRFSESRLKENTAALAKMVNDKGTDLRTRIALAYWARVALPGAQQPRSGLWDWATLETEAMGDPNLPARYLLVFASGQQVAAVPKDSTYLADLHELVGFLREVAKRDPENGWYPYLEIYPWTWIRQEEASWQVGNPEKAELALKELTAAMKRVVDSPRVVRELEPPLTRYPRVEGMGQAGAGESINQCFLFSTVVRPEETILKLTKDDPLPQYVLPVLKFDRKLLEALEPVAEGRKPQYFESVRGSGVYGISIAASDLFAGMSTGSYRDINDVEIVMGCCRDLSAKLDRDTWEVARKLFKYTPDRDLREDVDQLIALLEGQPAYDAREAYEKLRLFRPLMDAPVLVPSVYAQYVGWLKETVKAMSTETYEGMDEDYTEARESLLETLNRVDAAVQRRRVAMAEAEERWREQGGVSVHHFIELSGLQRSVSSSLDQLVEWAKQEEPWAAERLEHSRSRWHPTDSEADMAADDARALLYIFKKLSQAGGEKMSKHVAPIREKLERALEPKAVRHSAVLKPMNFETPKLRRARIAEQDQIVPKLDALLAAMAGHCPVYREDATKQLNKYLDSLVKSQENPGKLDWYLFWKSLRELEPALAEMSENGIQGAADETLEAVGRMIIVVQDVRALEPHLEYKLVPDKDGFRMTSVKEKNYDLIELRDKIREKLLPSLRDLVDIVEAGN